MVDLDRLERILIQAARERRPVTYGQLLAMFERKVTRKPVNEDTYPGLEQISLVAVK